MRKLIKTPFIILLTVLTLISLAACNSNGEKIESVESIQKLNDDGIPLIPKLGKIKIDGSNEDWQGIGYTIDLAADSYNRDTEVFDYATQVTLAWNSQGLCIYAKVKDDVIYTHPNQESLIHGDNINIMISEAKGGDEYAFFVLSPDLANESILINFEHNMKNLNDKSKISAVSKKTDDGYIIEAIIFFDNININPKNDLELALQVSAYDSDYYRDSLRAIYPWSQTNNIIDTEESKVVRLSDKHFNMHSPDVKGHLDDENLYLTLRSYSDKDYKNLSVYSGTNLLGSESISTDNEGRAVANVVIPLANINDDDLKLDIYIDDNLNQAIKLKGIKTKPQELKQPEFPFEADIQNYEKMDQSSPPDEGVIVFIGSSSFTLWGSVEEDMKPLNVINRSFGGSQMYQVSYFADRVIIPYKPSKIVVYEGDNDMLDKTPETFIGEVESFVRKIHYHLPDTEIYFVSVKMSPDREPIWHKYEESNKLLKEFTDKTDKVEFIDLVPAMEDENGNVNHEYFASDKLHISPKGYELWTSIIKPRLED